MVAFFSQWGSCITKVWRNDTGCMIWKCVDRQYVCSCSLCTTFVQYVYVIYYWTEKFHGKVLSLMHYSDNQSINQSSIASISPENPGSVAWQSNWCSMAKLMKRFRNINGSSGMLVYMGKGQVKEICFLKVATEMAERTDSRRLFQRDGAQEWKALVPVLILTLGAGGLISLLYLNESDGRDAASMKRG